jgi:hypothetical protein
MRLVSLNPFPTGVPDQGHGQKPCFALGFWVLRAAADYYHSMSARVLSDQLAAALLSYQLDIACYHISWICVQALHYAGARLNDCV